MIMWVISSPCRDRDDGRLLEVGEPLPNPTEDRVARFQRIRCIEWKGEEPQAEEPPPGQAKPKRRSRKRS